MASQVMHSKPPSDSISLPARRRDAQCSVEYLASNASMPASNEL
jgi:hypothetical protein